MQNKELLIIIMIIIINCVNNFFSRVSDAFSIVFIRVFIVIAKVVVVEVIGKNFHKGCSDSSYW